MPRDQQHDNPKRETNYEGLAYLGEYALSWAACLNNESIYNLLIERGANPDNADSFGNTVLHMVVVANQMVMNHEYWSFLCFDNAFTIFLGNVWICTEASKKVCKPVHPEQCHPDMPDTVLQTW